MNLQSVPLTIFRASSTYRGGARCLKKEGRFPVPRMIQRSARHSWARRVRFREQNRREEFRAEPRGNRTAPSHPRRPAVSRCEENGRSSSNRRRAKRVSRRGFSEMTFRVAQFLRQCAIQLGSREGWPQDFARRHHARGSACASLTAQASSSGASCGGSRPLDS